MGTLYKRVSPFLGNIGTTRFLTIATNVATQVVLDSGYLALTIFNVGSGSIVWGDSSIAVNSGNYLFVNQRVEWLDLQDGWSTYVRADSVPTLISISEYTI